MISGRPSWTIEISVPHDTGRREIVEHARHRRFDQEFAGRGEGRGGDGGPCRGGVGPAGMGSYHGRDGFLEFSHKKAVYKQTRSEMIALSRPPYGEKFRNYAKQQLK